MPSYAVLWLTCSPLRVPCHLVAPDVDDAAAQAGAVGDRLLGLIQLVRIKRSMLSFTTSVTISPAQPYTFAESSSEPFFRIVFSTLRWVVGATLSDEERRPSAAPGCSTS